MDRDFHKTARIARKQVDRAIFWYEVKLYTKVILIMGAIMAVTLWALFYVLERI